MLPAVAWSAIGSTPQPAGGCANVVVISVLDIMIATPKNAWNGTGMSSSSNRPPWPARLGQGSWPRIGPKNSKPVTVKWASMNWCPAGLPIRSSNSGVK